MNASSPAAIAARIPICKLRGLTATARRQLKLHNIVNCNQLLDAALADHDRRALAQATGVDPDLLRDLVQQADLLCVSGLGIMFMLMLKESGVDSLAALARQDAARLHAELRALNQAERITRRSPTLDEVTGWIAQARALARAEQPPLRDAYDRPPTAGVREPEACGECAPKW